MPLVRRRSIAAGLLVLSLALVDRAAAQPTPTPAPPGICTAGQSFYFFRNLCSEPVWLGVRSVDEPQSYPPVGGNWAIDPVCTANSDCLSNTCDQDSGRCTCTSAADCMGANCASDGKCQNWMDLCLPQTWTSGAIWPRTGCTLDSSVTPPTLTCQTGGCYSTANDGTQLLDCSVSNGGGSPTSPVTQVEVTSTTTSINYDVSLVAGYNVETSVQPVGGGWVPAGLPVTQVAPCLTMGCTSDLNATCPTNLQATNGSGTVIGCMDPCNQCDVNGAALHCQTQRTETWSGCNAIPTPTPPAATWTPTPTPTPAGSAGPTSTAGPLPTSGPVTYQDLYCAKNVVDSNSQASANQGTPTAFGQVDCFPGLTFVTPTFSAATGYALPAGMGVCLYTDPPQSTTPHFNDFKWTDPSGHAQSCRAAGGGAYDQPCGGYSSPAADYTNGLGYTCQEATYLDSSHTSHTDYLCMPPVGTGLGQCTLDADGGPPLYSATGGLTNAAWIDAAMTAANGTIPGTGTPFYQTFKEACPGAYAWQYDDASAGAMCTTNIGPTFRGIRTLFCQSQTSAELAAGPPPVEVVGLRARGTASRAGAGGVLGSVRLHGTFTTATAIALDDAAFVLTNVLDESGGAGELVRAPVPALVPPFDGSSALPPLVRRASARPHRALYETAPGTYPRIRVELRRVPAGDPGGAIDFSIRVDHARVAAPLRCSAGDPSTTGLETSFAFDLAGGGRVLVGGIVPWECLADGLLRDGPASIAARLEHSGEPPGGLLRPVQEGVRDAG